MSLTSIAVPWVIVGAGYTGTYLARALIERGTPVTVTRRTLAAAELVAAQAHAAAYDLAMPHLATPFMADDAVLVVAAPPGADPAKEIATLPRCRRLVYLSSTGVYGRGDGALVDETWPVAPLSSSGKARVAAERALLDRDEPSVALRIAGIHGPGRGIADRIKAGTYRIVGDGTSHISRIHVVDLVAAIMAAGDSDATGPINIADDDPSPIAEVANAFAAKLGVAPPPRTPVSDVTSEVAAMLTADRRIANARMHALGITLRYPSWRTVLAELSSQG